MHVWALRLSCETPAAPPDRAAGARTRQPKNSKRTHLSAPALQTPPKFNEKDQKRGKKEKNCGKRGKKKREILGPHRSGPHPSGPHHDTKNIGQKIGLAKIGLAKIGLPKLDWPKLDWPKLALAKIGRAQTMMAKNGLAKIGLAEIGQIRMAKTGWAKVGFFLPNCLPGCVGAADVAAVIPLNSALVTTQNLLEATALNVTWVNAQFESPLQAHLPSTTLCVT